MSNHAYESAAQLRPRRGTPTALGELAAHAALRPASEADGGGAPDDLAVIGVSVDSSDVAPGELFTALPGFTRHGAEFAPEAVAAGAVAVMTDEAGARMVRASCPRTPVLVADDPRAVVGPLSAEVYGHPCTRLTTAAVTGTNGKTTTSYFLDAILAVEEGVGAASLEASSHAIVLHRLDGTVVNVAGFTNLQRDHLDFHKTMQGYLDAKARLFTPAHAHRGVVCVDDQWGVQLADRVERAGLIPVDRLRAYPGRTPADWWVSDAAVSMTDSATTFTLHGPRSERIEASCPLPGLVNVQNAALALVMTIRAGVPADTAVAALAGAHNIPGRMQRITRRDGVRGTCIVDFAHTPDAMELALEAVRQITPGRLIVVFGSDGDRDRGKRPMLGAVAARLADVLVVTDENPRSEDPQSIRDAVLEGVRSVRPDLADVEEITTWRGDAVRRGVELCGPQDTVIVTGKGHEPFLEVAGDFIRYNDAPVMREAARAKWGPVTPA